MNILPVRVSGDPRANEQLLYFTSSSLLSDDRQLIFLSDRTGCPNIFWRNMDTGEERQLTSNTAGYLKSYVYFDGIPYAGLGKASVSVHAPSGMVYYLQGRQIRSVDLRGRERVLAEYPEDQMTAFTHVSADGSRLCVPTTDARALDGGKQLPGQPDFDIDARVQAEHLSSWLHIYDTATGKEIAREPVPDAWVTHVQFSPLDANVVVYNHEWPSACCGIRRMWLWDGKQHRRLRTEGAADWTCHEMWERDGRAILYHGSYEGGSAYIGRVRPDGSKRVEIALPGGWKRYGHFTEGGAGLLVSDGYYEEPGDGEPAGWGGSWISILHVDWEARRIDWQPLCVSGSSWKSQDAHPHPIFNHAADAVYFTSDREGKRAVYRIAVPKRSAEPASRG
ncbi:MAG: oligogalacturonate lyase family protein [Chthoniobacteraceae bacterium]|nr:oligogalacturonate lyase family protein [Chthoniobacteraceae bacterium]